MKLHITPTSPYGRIARIVVQEKGLSERVTVIEARTRMTASPYYSVVPSGRVPYLERDDGGAGLEDSALICRYLDSLDGDPRLHPAPETGDWDYGRLDATARSMLDGLAVYIREVRRPAGEQSPTIIAHERERARRLAAHWNGLIAHPLMQGPLTMAQIVLYVALDVCHTRGGTDWKPHNPALAEWFVRIAAHPGIAATA